MHRALKQKYSEVQKKVTAVIDLTIICSFTFLLPKEESDAVFTVEQNMFSLIKKKKHVLLCKVFTSGDALHESVLF